MQFLHRREFFRRLGAVLILLCGLKLLLPLPVPMSNFFPAATIFLLAGSALEDDGLVYVVGLVMFTASAAFFGLLALGGATAVYQLWPRILG